jgi:hypothetical protein
MQKLGSRNCRIRSTFGRLRAASSTGREKAVSGEYEGDKVPARCFYLLSSVHRPGHYWHYCQ